MSNINEFKSFVKEKPSLISYVRNGDMTWQKFYDLWYLYGPNHEEWNKYSDTKSNNTSKLEALGLANIFNAFKNVDMESVRQSVTGIQKAIGVIQEITGKDSNRNTTSTDTKEPYKPRPMFRRFED